jgi:LmbE family N-acetylglucosaminyl deacetylase
MHTEPAALFLFAHQDDEFGVFHRIEECVRQGLRVHCAYFTDGATAAASAQQRNAESLAVLRQLGVRAGDVCFAGQELGIADARLPEHLVAARTWLHGWLDQYSHIDSLHVTAWEGGHHDHDALHALAVTVAEERGLLPKLQQFALYNAHGCLHPFFNALSALPANGPVQAHRIPLRARLRYLRLCASYPSQKTTWIGLLPFVALRYLIRGTQDLQAVSTQRIHEQPHAGSLYYERRAFYTWAQMQARLAELTSSKNNPKANHD